jgi:hypothetical protein
MLCDSATAGGTVTTDYPENDFRAHVRDGRQIDLGRRAVRADLIRELLFSRGGGGPALVTPAGIALSNGVVVDRIVLDDATTVDGAPIPPLDLNGCTLRGGFSGRHGRFSRLSFNGCDYEGRAPPGRATVDLSGAEIATDLDLSRMKPASKGDVLWIRLVSARIDGSLILDGTRLRPPEPDKTDALDLTLCEIGGDAFFEFPFKSEGRVKGREVQIDGDAWFRGSRLDGKGREALFFQSARIGGLVVFDGAPAPFSRRFAACGQLNLHQLKLGGRFYIGAADIRGSPDADDPNAPIALCLESARIAGGSIGIGGARVAIEGRLQLAHLEVETDFEIRDSRLGLACTRRSDTEAIVARNLIARKLIMRRVRPLPCRGETDFEPKLCLLSVDLSDATLGKLEVGDCRFNGYFTAASLTCTGDVQIDARIASELDLEGVNIAGSLDISRLRMDQGAKLSLKDGSIGRALSLAHHPKRGEAVPVGLVAARKTTLRCLPSTLLIETLWWYENDEGERLLRQHAFLARRGVIRALDRRADAIRKFVAKTGHRIRDEQTAAEAVRLYCAYGESESHARWLLAGRASVPRYLMYRPDGCGEPRPALELPEQFFVLERSPLSPCEGPGFAFEACFLLDDSIGRGRIVLTVSGDQLDVSFQRRGIRYKATHVPRAAGPFAEHPDTLQPARAEWVIPAVLDDPVPAPPEELNGIEKSLRPYLRSDFSMAGRIDLRDLTCDTLDDQAGRFWGRQQRIEMNHFVYRQTTWEPDEAAAKPTPVERLQRWWARTKAERLPASWSGEADAERLRERTDIWAPWQLRRNWIYQQFSDAPTLLSPARHRVKGHEYRPQPFDQAARVARAEGRDEFAIQFEILRRRIDWDLFDKRARWTLGVLGILIAAAFLVARNGGQSWLMVAVATLVIVALMLGWRFFAGRRWSIRVLLYGFLFFVPVAYVFFAGYWDLRPLDFAIAALIFTLIRFGAKLSNVGLRSMFGYLRRPVRAIVALCAAFLLGWFGVEAANRMGMLIIDAAPVATAAGTETNGPEARLVMMSPGVVQDRPFAHNVACGDTISEPLYALDVLIPLVDLRQEGRCEVARVHEDQTKPEPRQAPETGPPPPDRTGNGLLTRSWDALKRLVEQAGALPQKESFWLGLKALYAIAGWFLVSLSILTFANMNPARGTSD